MHAIDIIRKGQLFATIYPDSNSVQTKKIMGDNQLSITFQSDRYIDLSLGDSCTVFGELYKVNALPVVTKISVYKWDYALTMDSEGSDLAKVNYFFLGTDNTLMQADFPLTGTADVFIDLLIKNLRRLIPVGFNPPPPFVKGEVIPTGTKTINFSGDNCYNALIKIANAFETEFYIQGKVIHLTKVQRDTGLLFRHGRGKGLYELTRTNIDNSSIATVLYAYGAAKNLPADYRTYNTRLLLPGQPFRANNVGKYGYIEATHLFEDVYPHRTGKVTGVDATNVLHFTDITMNFDVNDYLLPGQSPKVVFNSGQLSGYTFELSNYNHTTGQFTLLRNNDDKNLSLPNNSLKPAIGDEYVIVDISLPAEYIEAAEKELETKTFALLSQISEPQLSYQLKTQSRYLRDRNLTMNIGDLVWIKDTELNVERKIRVTSTIRGIVDEWDYQVEIADTVQPSTIERIINTGNSNAQGIGQLQGQLQSNNLLVNKVVGDLPTISDTTGFAQVYVELSTGKLYKKL